MNFKNQLADGESEQNIKGTLKVAVEAIPGLSINGDGSVDIDESWNETLSKTYLRVYGDFSPEEALPSNFVQAVDFFKKLGNSIVNDPDDMTIIKVHVTPLTRLCQ